MRAKVSAKKSAERIQYESRQALRDLYSLCASRSENRDDRCRSLHEAHVGKMRRLFDGVSGEGDRLRCERYVHRRKIRSHRRRNRLQSDRLVEVRRVRVFAEQRRRIIPRIRTPHECGGAYRRHPAPPFRRQASQNDRIRPMRRKPLFGGRGKGSRILFENMLYVHGKARDPHERPLPRYGVLRILYRRAHTGKKLRRILPESGRTVRRALYQRYGRKSVRRRRRHARRARLGSAHG